jgi:16S rRNA processing protein RimM
MLNQYLEAGKIVGTHGVKGELRVDPWCDSAQTLVGLKNLYLDKGARKMEVTSTRVHKAQLLLQLKGIDSLEQADALRGKILYFDRADIQLEEGRYFIQDLIGLDVFNADSFIYYGKLTDVLSTGANDVYQITSESKKDYLIPAIQDVIVNVNIPDGKMLIRPMRGIFEDED